MYNMDDEKHSTGAGTAAELRIRRVKKVLHKESEITRVTAIASKNGLDLQQHKAGADRVVERKCRKRPQKGRRWPPKFWRSRKKKKSQVTA